MKQYIDKRRDEFVKNRGTLRFYWCQVIPFWIERARFTDKATEGKDVLVKLGVRHSCLSFEKFALCGKKNSGLYP